MRFDHTTSLEVINTRNVPGSNTITKKDHVAHSVVSRCKDRERCQERTNHLCHRAYQKCASRVTIKAGTTFAQGCQSQPKLHYWCALTVA